ncbi:phage tail tape measure protein [Treponema pedis]|uniref:phage tail tape measure protein n=1 Tax=Treponema pedis TaxID=409322 RepID=UPI003141535B
MGSVRELVFKIIGDNEQFNKTIEETTKRLDDFKKKTRDSNELFLSVSKQAAIATTAIAALGLAAAKLAVDFNEGFGKVQTLIPGAKERVKEFQNEILNLSPAVGKTTKDLTDGLYEVISAFGDSADSAKNLELAAKGATAGGATTKDSIALLSAVTKAYGDTSNTAQKKVSDLAFTTVKLGQTSFPELAASIQRVTSQSKTLKISQEELFAVFSSGTGVIGGAAEVSTKYSALLTEMQKPGDRLAKTFKALGAESGTDLIEKFGGLQGALQALKSEAEKTGEPISNLFGSAEAGKLALYAAGEGAAKFTTDLQAMQEAAGATEQAFKDATTDGPNAFGFQLQQASLNAQAFAIKVGQELIPTLQAFLNPLFKGIEYLKNLDKQTLKTIIGIGKIIITATAVTAAVMGVKKAVDAVKTSMIALKGAFAANPFGLFVVAVTTAIVAIKELCSWLDRAAEKQREVEQQNLRASLSFPKEAESIIALSKAYIELSEKENLTAEEKLKLKKQTEELIRLAPALAGKLSLEESGYKNNLQVLKNFNAEKIKEAELNIQNAKTAHGNIARIIADNEKHLELLKQTNEYKTNARGDYAYGTNDAQIKKEEAALKELIEKEKIFAEEIAKNEILLAQLKDSKTALDSKTENGTTGSEISKHSEDLKKLDDAFQREKQIIQNRNTNEQQKNEELKSAEQKYYNDRIALLEQFHNENLENGKTYAQSEKEIVGTKNETIKTETEKTNALLNSLAEEKHKKEIEEINKTTEKTKQAIDVEIAAKRQAGLIEGNSEKEKTKNEFLLKANEYREKQNELLNEYIKLSSTGNDKDKEKADAIKKQADNLGKLSEQAKNSAGEVKKSFKEIAEEVANTIQKIGSAITETFSNITDIAKSIIDNKEAVRKQETAQQLTEIEREKNETLLEIDNELSETREQKQIEEAEREEIRRNEEYEKRLAHSNRNLQELKERFESETNLEKLRNLEKQIEEERKKKAEEEKRKKEEDEKRKRDKEARIQEITLLNARAQAEHEFATARIQTENAAGDASAKAAQQAAKWQKAQTSVSLIIKAAEQTALAVARFAIPDPIGGAAHTAAAITAGVQAGIVAGQPLPPDYIQQPLPPAPRLIKFAHGGIVMPSKQGTGITLPNGNAGLVAEAGIPEIILPLNVPNLEKMFKAAGINNNDNSKSFSYTPSYSIEISQNSEKSLDETLLNVLRTHDRELLNIVETGKQNWCVGG